jgi:hypothetical protein
MKTGLIKKLSLVIWMLVTVVSLLGLSSIAATATPPPSSPPAVITNDYQLFNDPATLGTYFDIQFNSAPPLLAGYCVEPFSLIDTAHQYTAQVYDYFGAYNPDYLDLLPAKIQTFPWNKIAYIINQSTILDNDENELPVTGMDKQLAIWFVIDSDFDPYGPEGVVALLVQAANANPNFVPQAGQLKPVICYVNDSVQLVFFEYPVDKIPVPPLPELPAVALFGLGLIGLGGAGWYGYKKSRAMAV